MEKVGITIRKIRKIKGISQKQAYSGIVSRSFATRFERGENDIQSGKLFEILNNLAVTPNEFQFINNNYKRPLMDSLLAEIYEMYDNHSFSKLSQWIRKHKSRGRSEEKYAVAYAEILLFTFDHSTMPVTDNTYILLTHLLEEKTWTLQEIKMVKIILPLVVKNTDVSVSIEDLLVKFEKNCGNYLSKDGDPFYVFNELISFYSIVFQIYLNIRNYKLAKEFKSKFLKINESQLDLGGKITLKFWLAIYELYFGDFEGGEETIHQLENVQRLLSDKGKLNIKTIFDIRRKDAINYRKNIAEEYSDE
ncbi:transcriptional regulator [Tetragenococcus halophilus subsp. flandriensis]|uniref:helix-turn-helix domain-containing protein n=2 Tax=Tetragenococcus halophilus TaxID=51669 RepID=UPI0023E9F483|nr:helix-turn-helix transcriptional regulator [Tetragenococcus halophilus]GMA09162.1 transcriptional regulator [Tetragenococcus halophilus subsp. flandriensis]